MFCVYFVTVSPRDVNTRRGVYVSIKVPQTICVSSQTECKLAYEIFYELTIALE